MRTKGPTTVDILVGQNIRAARNAQNVSQEILAKACGVTFQQIQKYEKGVNRVGASRLHQIADFLKVPVTQLIGEGKNGKTKLQPLLIMQDRIGAEFATEIWPKLTPAHRKALRDFSLVLIGKAA